jgi:hypothetical protein
MTSFLSRRLFRFSLRGLLLVVTIASLLLGWKVSEARTQRDVVAFLTSRGHQVCYDYQGDGLDRSEHARVGGVTLMGTDLTKLGPSDWSRYVGTDFAHHATVLKLDDEADLAEIEAILPQLKRLPTLRVIYIGTHTTCWIGALDHRARYARAKELLCEELPWIEVRELHHSLAVG